MQVTVVLRPDAAQEVERAAAEMGVELVPTHPGVDDPVLATYFQAEVPDMDTAARVVERLRRCAAVDTAYLKPPDALP